MVITRPVEDVEWLLSFLQEQYPDDYLQFINFEFPHGQAALQNAAWNADNFKLLFPFTELKHQINSFHVAVTYGQVECAKWFPIEKIPDSDLLEALYAVFEHICEQDVPKRWSEAMEIQNYLLEEAAKRGLKVETERLYQDDNSDTMDE